LHKEYKLLLRKLALETSKLDLDAKAIEAAEAEAKDAKEKVHTDEDDTGLTPPASPHSAVEPTAPESPYGPDEISLIHWHWVEVQLNQIRVN